MRGDSRLLMSLFQNLIGNALKFCQPGKAPRIVITGQIVNLPDVSRCAEIQLKDDGIGFDEKNLDRILPFSSDSTASISTPARVLAWRSAKKWLNCTAESSQPKASP